MDRPPSSAEEPRVTLWTFFDQEPWARKYLVVAALVEVIALLVFLLVMDRQDRLHWLVLIGTFLIYETVAFSTLAAVAYVRRMVLGLQSSVEGLYELRRLPGSESSN